MAAAYSMMLPLISSAGFSAVAFTTLADGLACENPPDVDHNHGSSI